MGIVIRINRIGRLGKAMAHYTKRFTVILLVMLYGCAMEFANVMVAVVEDLPPDDLIKLQFYSGSEPIVFRADSSRIGLEDLGDEMPPGKVVTENQITIGPYTPGQPVRFDRTTNELSISFDPDWPALVYYDHGRGLALSTSRLEIDGVVYWRVMKFKGRGMTTADVAAPLFLLGQKKTLGAIKVKEKKAKGVDLVF